MLVIAVSLFALPVQDVAAERLCGHYTNPKKSDRFYEGEDPEADEAGFERCFYGGLGYGYSYVSPDKEANGFYHDSSKNHDYGIQALCRLSVFAALVCGTEVRGSG